MKSITAADLVWIAAASLSREFPDRKGFSPDEILRRARLIEPDLSFPDVTIRTHIGSHCAAMKKPDPGKHRKLHANDDGTYRLYRPTDPCHPGRRQGKTLPDPNRIPAKYHDLIDWYRARYATPAQVTTEADPVLALRGLGKQVWRELGGGEKFIRELRENWYRVKLPLKHARKAKPARRSRAV